MLRNFGIAYPPALACALLYSLLPYHFAHLDLGHYFLGCYQIVPLSILLALWLYCGPVGRAWRCVLRAARMHRIRSPTSRGRSNQWRIGYRAALVSRPWRFACCKRWLGRHLLRVFRGILSDRRLAYRPACSGEPGSPLWAASAILGGGDAGYAFWRNLAPFCSCIGNKHGTNPAVTSARRPVTDAEIYAFKLTVDVAADSSSHRIPPLERLRRHATARKP